MTDFKKLGLSDDIVSVLEKLGFEKPTEIQEQTIPVFLETNNDIIGEAKTGTGKTAAFGLPILEKLQSGQKHTQVMILTPTRELAVQVYKQLLLFKGKKDISIFPIYGGQSISKELSELRRGINIIVGTPGRVIDHLKKKYIKLDKIEYFVLDEVDEMLKMGFIDDVETVIKESNESKRMLFFSATMPREILNIAKKYLKNPHHIKIEKKEGEEPSIQQFYFNISESDKTEVLYRVLENEHDFYGIIFCKRKIDVDLLKTKLLKKGYKVDAIHGDIQQKQREQVLENFRNKTNKILIATDVAARGIDINNLNFVVNYDLPENVEEFTHRIGRTGRAGKTGTALNFATSGRDTGKLSRFQSILGKKMEKGVIPNKNDIILSKEKRLIKEIENFEHNSMDLTKDYNQISKDLIRSYDPELVISMLMYKLYGKISVEYKDIINRELVDRNRGSGGSSSRGRFSSGRRNDYRGKRSGSSNRSDDSTKGSRPPRRGGSFGGGRKQTNFGY